MAISRSRRLIPFLILLLVGLLVAPNVGNSADPQTAQEKYDALVEAGIFEGFPDGQAHLDQNMTRAQAAKIVAKVLGLEEDTSAASVYKDLKDAEWAAGFIGAATEAGILNGRGNGVFDPSSNVTFQELAKIMVEALDLEVDENATVEGASDWAKAYVAAAVSAGVIPAQTDYTASASREVLVAASYTAQVITQANQNVEGNKDEDEEKDEETPAIPPIVYTPPPLAISSFRQVDANEFTVTFNQSFNPANIRLSVTKNGNPVVAEAISVGNNQYRISFNENVQDEQYTVSASYADSSTIFSSASVTASVERLTKLEFTNIGDTVAHSDQTGIEIRALNQFGKPMQTPLQLEVNSAVPAELDDKYMAVILDTSSLQQGLGTIAVSVNDSVTGITVAKTFKVGTIAYTANSKFIGSLRNGDGNEVTEAVWGNTYHANFNLYDQYGHLIFTPSTSPNVINTPFSDYISVGTYANALSSEPGTFSVPVTFSSSSNEQQRNYTLTLYAGATNSMTYTVAGALPKLGTPTAAPAGGEVESGTEVSLSATNGATVYYTTDGTDPKTNGTVYSTPIEVTQAMTINAIAVKDGMRDSDILSVSFTILNTYSPLDLINYEAENGILTGSDTEVTAQTFVDAGITGVTSDNLFYIRYYIDGSDKPYPRSKADLQAIVDQYLLDQRFEAIKAYFEDDTGPKPTIGDFGSVGLTIHDALDFDELLMFLVSEHQTFRNSQGMFGRSLDSVVSVQEAIDNYFL